MLWAIQPNFARWARRIKHWKEYSRHPDLDELYLRAQFRWAGHVARLHHWRGDNILTDLMRYRDLKWLRRQQATHGHQGHDKRIRVWRWETAITDYHGEDWHQLAQDKGGWEKTVPSAARWRKRNR